MEKILKCIVLGLFVIQIILGSICFYNALVGVGGWISFLAGIASFTTAIIFELPIFFI